MLGLVGILILYWNDVIAIEVDGISQPWAVAGMNVTVFLAGVDPNQLS